MTITIALVKRVVFGLTVFACVYFVSSSTAGSHIIHEVSVCSEEHRFRCQEREVISDLVCGNGTMCSLDVNRTLYTLCQGQQTCSNLGLAEMLASQCKHSITRNNTLLVRFTCLPGSTSSCRSNICTHSSGGLSCPNGSLVHIRGMTCGSVTGECPISTYRNMYICEGVNYCAASGLAVLMSENCQRGVGWKRNVLVNYVCVSDKHIERTCTPGKIRLLDRKFGILRSPVLVGTDTGHTRTKCTWYINPSSDTNVKIVVHMVTAKVTPDGCDPHTLSITFVDCTNGSVVTRQFCNVISSGLEVMSCGQVWIESTVPPEEETADTFVVSYQTFSSLVPNVSPHGLPSCLAPPKTETIQKLSSASTHTKTASKTSPRPSPKSISVGRNYGPGDGLFEYRDATHEEDIASSDNGDNASPLSKYLRLMILYIFFGVVIIVLIIALIAVIVSYHRISKFKCQRVDSSEKTALWTHNEDTPLETFLNNNLVESSGTLASETACAFKTCHETDQVVATIHCESVVEQDESPTRLSAGSGVSTFLAGRSDSQCKDLTRSGGSFASTASYRDISDTSQNNCHDNTGSVGYLEIGHDLPNYCDVNIYETVGLDNSITQRNDNGSGQSVKSDNSLDKNCEDKVYEVANHDSAVVGLQYNPCNDLHYLINNDEYAVVSKACKPLKVPNSPSHRQQQQQLSNNCLESGENIDFRPTSGPYDKKRSMDEVNTRWSKGDRSRWTDEV